MKKLWFMVIVLYMFAFMPTNAYAYIDPSTGSMIIQVVSAAALSGIVFFKIYWNKVKEWLKRKQ